MMLEYHWGPRLVALRGQVGVQNDSYHTSVLHWPQPAINPWTCRVMVPFILEQETNEALLFLSDSAPSHTSLGQTPTFSTGDEVLYSNICPIWFLSGRVLKKSDICAMLGRIFEIHVFKKIRRSELALLPLASRSDCYLHALCCTPRLNRCFPQQHRLSGGA